MPGCSTEIETLNEQFKDLVANRLLVKGELIKQESEPVKEETERSSHENHLALPSGDFTKVEKNLASLGFFTPSSKRIKNEKVKTITFVRVIDGKRIEARATIAPTAIYGLPITADQDKYLALQKIVADIQQREGIVSNPVGFSSAELLRLLNNHRDSGKNYKEVEEWLNVMTSTTIISEGVVYFAGKRTWAKDRFHVFDRAVSFGKEIEPGKVADKNYVWLSEWQLENINHNYLLPINLESYRQLKNHISKALVPLLQIWLYATRDEGSFEKRYDEICRFLGIRQYQYPSLIKQTLGPSLDELKAFGYLADWKLEKTSDLKSYKIVFFHGEKFHNDRRRRLTQKEQASAPVKQKHRTTVQTETAQLKQIAPETTAAQSEQGIDESLLIELTKRGIPEFEAQKYLSKIPSEQAVLDQLEWGDHCIRSAPGKIKNPAGFYISLIRHNVIPPPTFETNRQKQAREEKERAVREKQEQALKLTRAYQAYRGLTQRGYVEHYLKELRSAPDDFQVQLANTKNDLSRANTFLASLSNDLLDQAADRALRSKLAKQVPLLTFGVFKRIYKGKLDQTPYLNQSETQPPPPPEKLQF